MPTPRQALLAAFACILLVVIGLAVGADPTDSELRRFFYLWQTRYMLGAVAGLWLATGLVCYALSSKLLSRFFAGSYTLAAVTGILELAALAGVVDSPALFGMSGKALGAEAVPHLDVRGVTYEDTAQGWGLAPPPIPFHFQTDRRGFRNAKDRADADVYLLGDSFLVAGLVPVEQTLGSRLEAALGRSVANLALIGLSVEEERDLLQASKLPLAGRTVVHFVFEGNDLVDSIKYRQTKQTGVAPDTLARSERTLTYQLLMALQRWSAPVSVNAKRRTCSIRGRTYMFGWGAQTMRCPECERQTGAITAALAETRRYVEQHGGRYLLVMLPDKLRVLGPSCSFPAGSAIRNYRAEISRLPEAIARFAAETGVAYLDLSQPLLDAAAARRTIWFAGDTHWNAAGIEVAANALAGWAPLRGSPPADTH